MLNNDMVQKLIEACNTVNWYFTCDNANDMNGRNAYKEFEKILWEVNQANNKECE